MRLICLVALVLSIEGLTAPFAKYRAQLSKPVDQARLQKDALERVRTLRKLMGTENLKYPALGQSSFTVLKGSQLVNGNKKTSSGILKILLGRTAEELREQEEEGAPAPFDPSKFDFEIDQDRMQRRYAFCEKKLGKDYAQVVQELLYDKLYSTNQAGPSGPAFDLERKLVAELRPLIPAAITKKLGLLSSVDFVDGRIIKVYFTAGNFEYPLSYSILSTFRTQRDKYFLITLECLRHHLDTKATEKKPADAGYQSVAQYLLPVVTERLKVAGTIHSLLKTLSREEEHALLDLFLALQDGELPASEEMQIPDDPKKWNVGDAPPSFPAFAYQRSDNAIRNRNSFLDSRKFSLAKRDSVSALLNERKAAQAMAPVEELLADYQFYKLYFDQTEQLMDFLIEEKHREAIEKKILKDMGGN